MQRSPDRVEDWLIVALVFTTIALLVLTVFSGSGLLS
jgi:hypothetical protein